MLAVGDEAGFATELEAVGTCLVQGDMRVAAGLFRGSEVLRQGGLGGKDVVLGGASGGLQGGERGHGRGWDGGVFQRAVTPPGPVLPWGVHST